MYFLVGAFFGAGTDSVRCFDDATEIRCQTAAAMRTVLIAAACFARSKVELDAVLRGQ